MIPITLRLSSRYFSGNKNAGDPDKEKIEFKENRVPSNNIERAFGFASLAAKMAFGGLSEGIKNTVTGKKTSLSSLLSLPLVYRPVVHKDKIINPIKFMRGPPA